MGRGSGIQFRLVLTLAVIGLVAIAGILAILPYRLYQRDIRMAAAEAHRVSAVVQAALADRLASAGDARDLVNRLQGAGGMRIALSRLEAGDLTAGAVVGRGSSVLDDTDLRYVSAPVLDAEGRAWIAELQFDLSSMKRDSLRLVLDVVLLVAVGATAFGAIVFAFVRRAFVLPLRELARLGERMGAGEDVEHLPSFESLEMAQLASALGRLAENGVSGPAAGPNPPRSQGDGPQSA
jgi:methyl-accepting chemotaxis protein